MISDKTRVALSSLWLVASILFTLLSCQAVNALPKQNLHHHMTKGEIEHYFGVDEHDKVPEYDITHPYQSNEQGEFVSYSIHSQTRRKRNTRPQKSSFYKLNAFGTELHLKLKRNDHLMAPGMKVLRQHSDGKTTQHPAPENTYYLGHVASDPQSMVAVSNFGGLTGMVKTSRDTLFVHPLPTHLAKHVTNKNDGTPHLVFRRSITEHRGSWDTSEDEGEERAVLTSVKNQTVSSAMSDDFAKPESKVLEVALLYPPSLEAKYNASLYKYIGGVERFLLLLANMVFRMFQDPTIGRIKIVFAVSEIKMIQPSEYGFNASTPASKILGRIKVEVNKQKVSYDVFAFISNTLPGGGRAFVGEACIRTTGSLNREIGLQTASYIAHETAHNINVGHDTGDCDQNYIMHYKLPSGENAAKWSLCSRTTIQNFLANPKRSRCLKSGPVNHVTRPGTTLEDTLPGLKVDGDKQCELRHGHGWKRHDTHQCHHFKCSFSDASGTAVVGEGAAVVDGTNCGQGKGCFKGKCINMDFKAVVNGVWSGWSDYSQCSRPCEGIQFRTRRCIRHSKFAAPCRGDTLQYRVCNSKCGRDDKFDRPFWDQRCRQKYGNASRPFIFGHCRIFCITGQLARSLANNVNGYRYSLPNAANYENTVCIKGAGIPFGCDHLTDSTTQFDRCSVCGGNGNTCKLVQRNYTDNPDASGPSNGVAIMELPIGTSNAVISFKHHTKHRLGVQDGNGNYLVGYPLGNKGQTIEAAGAQIRYTPNKRKKLFKDSITVSLTATNEVLRIMYFKISTRDLNPGVKARLYVPTTNTANDRPEDFEWRLSDWTGSSRTCPSGTRARNRRCVRKDDGTTAGDDACSKPIPAVCEPMWTVLEWERCSKSCGAGTRSLIVKCLEKVGEDNFRETNSCTAVKPTIITEPCNEFPCPAQWKIGEWSECSVTCGNGTQERMVLCSRINETGRESLVDDAFCQHQKPVSETKCMRIPCPITACTSNPCLNGATCVDNGANDRYTCKCPQGFGGNQCQDSIPACTSNPCLNGATCVDNGARDNYTCNCPEGFRGDRCQVSNFYEIGCFVYKTDTIPLLKDLTKQFDKSKTEPTVLKCAELVQEKGYKFFVLGSSGKCYSALNATELYFEQGSGRKSNCPNGVGAKKFVSAYTFDPLPVYERLGCYVAVKKATKSFRTCIDLRKQFDKKDTTSTIERCLRIGISDGYKYFSVKNSGVCCYDSQAAVRYSSLGKAKAGACKDGVGLPNKKSNMVYRIKE